MKIINDFLPIEEFNYIRGTILGDRFPWFFCNYVTKEDVLEDPKHRQFQFYCNLYANNIGVTDEIPGQIINIFEHHLPDFSSFLRVKANLTPKSDTIKINEFHTDFPNVRHYNTAVFYVNTNNGYTLFEDGTKVNSEGNKIVIFDGNEPHTGSSCTNENCRVVINLNWV